jgi:beta-galactosidase
VVLSPDKTSVLTADGKDATVFNISITLMKKDARFHMQTIWLNFKLISGDAKIIGVGNGDPSSHEPDKCADGAWQRSAFNGKCQVIIQAGKTVGTVNFEAKSNGLQAASATLNLVKS